MTVSKDLVNQKMVVAQNRCQKWKEHDKISNKYVYLGDFRAVSKFEKFKRIVCWALPSSICFPYIKY